MSLKLMAQEKQVNMRLLAHQEYICHCCPVLGRELKPRKLILCYHFCLCICTPAPSPVTALRSLRVDPASTTCSKLVLYRGAGNICLCIKKCVPTECSWKSPNNEIVSNEVITNRNLCARSEPFSKTKMCSISPNLILHKHCACLAQSCCYVEILNTFLVVKSVDFYFEFVRVRVWERQLHRRLLWC